MAVFRMKRGEVVANSVIVSPEQHTAATMRSTSRTPIGTPIVGKERDGERGVSEDDVRYLPMHARYVKITLDGQDECIGSLVVA
jgi:hypothetical protein